MSPNGSGTVHVQVIATGLAKQPTDRYPSTIEMAAAARGAITGPVGLIATAAGPAVADAAGTNRRARTAPA